MAERHCVDASIPSARRLSTDSTVGQIGRVSRTVENDTSDGYSKGVDFFPPIVVGSGDRLLGRGSSRTTYRVNRKPFRLD